jgi:hypothetical protein
MAEPTTTSLSPTALATLTAVLDALIPANDARGLPGAGALGLATEVASSLARAPMLAPLVTGGLDALGDLSALPDAARRTRVTAFLDGEAGFVMGLLFHAYTAYYRQPRVLAALGLEPRPPHPRGYDVAPSDPALLEPVRRRPPFYRFT